MPRSGPLLAARPTTMPRRGRGPRRSTWSSSSQSPRQCAGSRTPATPRSSMPSQATRSGPCRSSCFVIRRQLSAPCGPTRHTTAAQRPWIPRALALITSFAGQRLTRVVTSDAVRCVETVRPYVGVAGARLELQPVLSEEGHPAKPHGPEKLARTLFADGAPTVVCSHRPVLPELIAAAADQASELLPGRPWSRAISWSSTTAAASLSHSCASKSSDQRLPDASLCFRSPRSGIGSSRGTPRTNPRDERLAITVAEDDELHDEGELVFEAVAGAVDVPSKATPTN